MLDLNSNVGRRRNLSLYSIVICLVSITAMSADLTIVDKSIQVIEKRLGNYRGKLDIDARLAMSALVEHGDASVEPVLAFTRGKGHESLRRTMGVDILFRIQSEISRKSLARLFSENYTVLTNNLPSSERLNSASVVYEPDASEEYNAYMLAYYIAKESVLRGDDIATEIISSIPEKDLVSKAVCDANHVLSSPDRELIERISFQTDPVYIVGLVSFLPMIKTKLEGNENLLEKFRKWYFDVLSEEALDETEFAVFVNAVEEADANYFYGSQQFQGLIDSLNSTGQKNRSNLLTARKHRFEQQYRKDAE